MNDTCFSHWQKLHHKISPTVSPKQLWLQTDCEHRVMPELKTTIICLIGTTWLVPLVSTPFEWLPCGEHGLSKMKDLRLTETQCQKPNSRGPVGWCYWARWRQVLAGTVESCLADLPVRVQQWGFQTIETQCIDWRNMAFSMLQITFGLFNYGSNQKCSAKYQITCILLPTGDWISSKCSAIIHIWNAQRADRGTGPHHRSRKPVPDHFSSLCRWDVQTERRGVWESTKWIAWLRCVCVCTGVCVFVERDWEEKRTDVNSQLVSHRFPDWRLSIQWAASGGRREKERKEKTERPNRTTIVPIQYTGKPKIRACEGWLTHILVGKAVLSSPVCIVVILHLHYIL